VCGLHNYYQQHHRHHHRIIIIIIIIIIYMTIAPPPLSPSSLSLPQLSSSTYFRFDDVPIINVSLGVYVTSIIAVAILLANVIYVVRVHLFCVC
jgi:hypothetical protein